MQKEITKLFAGRLRGYSTYAYFTAILRGIACKTSGATAAGCMVDHVTLGGNAAYSGTGIATLVVQTGTILRAVAVEHTLRTTLGVRVTAILGQAGAGADAVAFLADGIGATRTRVAGLGDFGWHNDYREGAKRFKRRFALVWGKSIVFLAKTFLLCGLHSENGSPA